MENLNKAIEEEALKFPLLRTIGRINLIALIVVIVICPILFIWIGWSIIWKIMLTALIIYVITLIMWHVLKSYLIKIFKKNL